ncbi:SPOR domain-containing protein [Thermonema rossianum]|uniref:SPOR domain-containing protein n=1 Tax=Thermonema rossianum TaxID=55505 RepID=UPI00068BA276|nr:SPOR domain-containing protein [Thermonema rossianum]
MRYLLLIAFATLLLGCAPHGRTQKNEAKKDLAVDTLLAKVRPVYDYTPVLFTDSGQSVRISGNNVFLHQDTETIFRALSAYKRILVRKEMPGYRVQVFVSPDRSEAVNAKNKCYSLFHPDYEVYFEYSRPKYRVKVGDFASREEAYELYKEAKRYFPTAIVVPDRVVIITEATEDDLMLIRKRREAEKENR